MAPTPHTAIASLHIAAKFFGIHLFSIDPVTYKPHIRACDIICGFIAITFYALIFYIHWIHAFGYVFLSSKILEKAIPLMMSMHYVFFTTIIIVSNINRRAFGDIFKTLMEVDRNFEYFDVKFDYKVIGRTVTCFVLKVLIWIAILTALGAVLARKFDELRRKSLEHVFFFWCLCIAAIVMMTFRFSAVGIGRRFQKVNKVLR